MTTSFILLLGFLAFLLLLQGLGVKVPFADLLNFLERNGREAALVIVFGLFMAFLVLVGVGTVP